MTTNLVFKRQFILGPEPGSFPNWLHTAFDQDQHLSIHPDLSLSQAEGPGKKLMALGDLFDPHHPESDNQRIVSDIMSRVRCFDDFEKETATIGGRWLMLVRIGDESRIYPDASGSRPIYYTRTPKGLWLGSTPQILAETLGLKRRDDRVDAFYKTSTADWWPGDLTPYSEIKHCLPNHYLDLSHGRMIRFWPKKPVEKYDIKTAADKILAYLGNILLGVSNRFTPFMALTAGYDSRVLLAASKRIHNRFHFFTLKYPGVPERDISVPASLAKILKLNYSVERFDTPDESFLELFDRNASYMIKGQCRLNAKSYLKYEKDIMFVEGTVSGVIRAIYYKRTFSLPDGFTPEDLAKKSGFDGNPSDTEVISKWLDSLPADCHGINVLDLFLWEQKLGCWNAMDYMSQDTVRRVMTPFNCRRIYEIGLGVHAAERQYPYALFRQMCRKAIPETKKIPINNNRAVEEYKYLARKLKHNVKQILQLNNS